MDKNNTNENLKPCKACGERISKKAKKCPNCGEDQRNFFMRHKIITGILIIIIIGVIGSMGSNNESGKQNTSMEDSTDKKDTGKVAEERKEEIIDISAKELGDTYDANEVNADDLYKGKLLRITGTVNSIDVMLEQTFIVLEGGGEFGIVGIQCFFKDEEEIDKIKNLNKGDAVTVVGRVEGQSINVSVKDCILE